MIDVNLNICIWGAEISNRRNPASSKQSTATFIWKCTDVQPYLTRDYNAAPPTKEGEYYEWQKMKNIEIHIRRTWTAQNDWQMLPKNQEEQKMLAANDEPKPSINVSSILQSAIESSSSEEKQSSVGRILEMSKNTLMQTFKYTGPRSRSPRLASAATSSIDPTSTAALPIAPDHSTLSRLESAPDAEM